MTCFFTSSAVIVLCLFLLFSSCKAAKYQRTVRYDDEILIRCPANGLGIKELLESDAVDIWQVTADGMVDVRIHEDLLKETTTTATAAKRECVTLANVETLVQQFENITIQHKPGQDEWFEEYHGYIDIYDWYYQLTDNNSNICQFVNSIGTSFENREQFAVQIGIGDDTKKMKIYFQCQIDAREWISGATCMYIADYLVKNANTEPVKELLEQLVFVFLPFANPDGYEYTDVDRLWRKNRRINSGSNCVGVDLNRNYNDHWNEGGSSSNPCSDTYHGTGPASEPETQNTLYYFKYIAPVIGAIDWQSYGQLILRPYGWTHADAPDEAQLKDIGDAVRDAINKVHGKNYTSQKASDLYLTGGTASDWFYGKNATSTNKGYRAAGYTIKLRDTGQYGFLLPPDQIIPTGEENVAGVLTFAQMILKNPIKFPKIN